MSRRICVLDASALLCLLFEEPGAARVAEKLATGRMSAVNLSEVIAKLVDRGADELTAIDQLARLDLEILDFNRARAQDSARLRSATRRAGLSLGDRACLALTLELGAVAVTADRAWATLDIGIEVELVR